MAMAGAASRSYRNISSSGNSAYRKRKHKHRGVAPIIASASRVAKRWVLAK